METVYTIPGLGRYLVQSVQNRDYFISWAPPSSLATPVVIMNLVVDILLPRGGPRIDLDERRVKWQRNRKSCLWPLQPDVDPCWS